MIASMNRILNAQTSSPRVYLSFSCRNVHVDKSTNAWWTTCMYGPNCHGHQVCRRFVRPTGHFLDGWGMKQKAPGGNRQVCRWQAHLTAATSLRGRSKHRRCITAKSIAIRCHHCRRSLRFSISISISSTSTSTSTSRIQKRISKRAPRPRNSVTAVEAMIMTAATGGCGHWRHFPPPSGSP